MFLALQPSEAPGSGGVLASRVSVASSKFYENFHADCSLVNHNRVGKVVAGENSSSFLFILSRRWSSSAGAAAFMG